jgi:hypothetical protein
MANLEFSKNLFTIEASWKSIFRNYTEQAVGLKKIKERVFRGVNYLNPKTEYYLCTINSYDKDIMYIEDTIFDMRLQ